MDNTNEKVEKNYEKENNTIESSIEVKRGFRFQDLFNLFFKPDHFFNSNFDYMNSKYLYVAIWLVGISKGSSNLDKQLFKVDYGTRESLRGIIHTIVDSWGMFWFYLMFIGIVSGYFTYLIGGWWYNVRLKWSTTIKHDKKQGRSIYIYTALISAVPTILATIIYTVFFKSYRIAYNSDEMYSIVLLIFPFWSIICSYKAVMSKFKTKKWAARMWFLILPMMLNIFTLGLFVALFSLFINY